MLIKIIYEECKNVELLEKMKRVKNYEEYREIVESGEYDREECIEAFAAVNSEYMGSEHLYEMLYDTFYDELEGEITEALEYKAYREPKEGTALALLLKKIHKQNEKKFEN